MKNYLVTFETSNGIVKSIDINARDVDDAKAKTSNANGEISYFYSILVNDNEEE